MIDKNSNLEVVENEYKDLIVKIKNELPNLVLPSMGMFDEVERIDIDSKEFVISNKED